MSQPKVSIIIPTYNENEHIGSCLTSLTKQSFKSSEIIVVDDGSIDNTIEIIKQFPGVTLFARSHNGPAAARNFAASKAQGQILVFVDADMTFGSDFIEKLIDPIVKEKAVGTFTKQELVSNLDNIWARSWSLLRGFKDGTMHPLNSPDTQPVFRAITKQAFDQAGGFDHKRGYDDDWSLSERLGIQALHASGAIMYHANPDSMVEIFDQVRWVVKRRYKFGPLGIVINMARVLIVTLVRGVYFGVRYWQWKYFVASLVYLWGSLIGLTELLLAKRLIK